MNYINYIFGTFFILKNKLTTIFEMRKNIPRIRNKMPLLTQYSYFYSSSNEIIDGLYLGSSYNAYDINDLKKNNISVIINVTDEISNFYENNILFDYYKFPIKDNNEDNIEEILEETYKIIDDNLDKRNNILVHCYMGASRSATVVIHYLMKKLDYSYDDARKLVIKKRPLVNLSHKFHDTLKKLNKIN